MTRLIVVAACLATACGSSDATLYVDVKTDLVPEIEFAAVRVELLADDPAMRTRDDTVATRSDDYVTGVRVAELGGLSKGYVATVRVALLAVGGSVRVERLARVTLASGANGITVLLTRDCEGVRCPGAGDSPAAIACLGGACVDATCSEEHPELCPAPECTADGDCAAGAACANARCVSGTCALFGDDARCAPSEWCHPVDGCRLLPAATDGGVDAGASCTDGMQNGSETGVDCGGPCPPCGWWNARFTRRNAIRFDYAKGPDLLDFPVAVRVTASTFDLPTFQPGGSDLRFVDGDGTVLPHEIENWGMTGTSIVWVRVPQISAASTADVVYAYYGYADAPPVPDATAPEDVWSDGYVLVHHSSAGRDSTRNDNDGTTTGTGIATGGPLGFAVSLPADGMAHVMVPSSASLDGITSALTVSALVSEVRPHDPLGAFVCRQGVAGMGGDNDFWIGTNGDALYAEVTTAGAMNFPVLAPDGLPPPFAHVALAWDGSVLRIYRDGVERASVPTSGAIAPTDGAVYIGGDRNAEPVGGPPDADFFAGTIDEVRIQSVLRPLEWIAAEHANYLGDFVVVGATESLP